MITAFLINNPYFQTKKPGYSKEKTAHAPEGKPPIIVGRAYGTKKNPKRPIEQYNTHGDTFWKNR